MNQIREWIDKLEQKKDADVIALGNAERKILIEILKVIDEESSAGVGRTDTIREKFDRHFDTRCDELSKRIDALEET